MLIDVVLHEFIAIQAHLLPKALSAAATCSHERNYLEMNLWLEGWKQTIAMTSISTHEVYWLYMGPIFANILVNIKVAIVVLRFKPYQTFSLGPNRQAWHGPIRLSKVRELRFTDWPHQLPRGDGRQMAPGWLVESSFKHQIQWFPTLKKTTLNPFILEYQSSKKHPCEISQVWRLCNCIRIEGACICI